MPRNNRPISQRPTRSWVKKRDGAHRAGSLNTTLAAAASPRTPSTPHVFLIGRPPISELLGFMKTMSIDGENADLATLTSEWRSANDHVRRLETSEAGVADSPRISPLPSSLAGAAGAVLAAPAYQRTYRFVPSDIAVIDLNSVVVFQKYIDLAHVEQLKRQLGENPTPESIFDLVFPLHAPQAPFRYVQNQNGYTFTSPSTDLRLLEPQIVDPTRISNFEGSGRPASVLALTVGFGANFLSVMHAENRLVLTNGSHRAYALRDLGITEVPCLIQRVTRRDELELMGVAELTSNPDRFLTAARPPMLKDYFDPLLRKIVDVRKKNRVVTVQFGYSAVDVPE